MSQGPASPPRQTLVLFVVFAIAAVSRVALAVILPQVSPDGLQYLSVGDNIALNGCISLSPPETAECAPHWGGNHPPGYPLLLAVSRLLSLGVVGSLILQSVLVALAITRLSRALMLVSERQWVGLAAGLVMGLSPIHLAWSRFVLPDTVAVAATLWLAAEILLSLHQQKFRIVPIALAFAAAFFARYDGILLLLPIVLTAFLLHPVGLALRKGLICALLVAIPISLWSIRNVSQDLAFIPDPFLQDGGRSPRGYLSWGNTWIVSIYDGAAMAYPLQDRAYESIRINERRAFDSQEETLRVAALLDALRVAKGKPFPLEIDERFSALASERRAQRPLRHYVLLPLRRAAEFWGTPFHSFAWPLEIESKLTAGDREEIAKNGTRGLISVALRHPGVALGKATIFGYRALLITGLAVLVVMTARQRGPLMTFSYLAIGYALFRTVVLSMQLSIDSRYIIEAAGMLEAAFVAMLAVALGMSFDKRESDTGNASLKGPA